MKDTSCRNMLYEEERLVRERFVRRSLTTGMGSDDVAGDAKRRVPNHF